MMEMMKFGIGMLNKMKTLSIIVLIASIAQANQCKVDKMLDENYLQKHMLYEYKLDDQYKNRFFPIKKFTVGLNTETDKIAFFTYAFHSDYRVVLYKKYDDKSILVMNSVTLFSGCQPYENDEYCQQVDKYRSSKIIITPNFSTNCEKIDSFFVKLEFNKIIELRKFILIK